MVSEAEITQISELMKIRILDHREYVEKVHDVLDFFDMLDSAGVGGEKISARDTPISCLREDRHVAFDGRLIDGLKQYRDGYVRAPKMT